MRVENSIYIDAPIESVWSVTHDVEKWPDWTPTVTSVRLQNAGVLGLGSVARIKQPLQPESVWVVTDFIPGKRFAWQTSRNGLTMLGTHELAAEGRGTRNLLSVDASGPVALLLWPVLRFAVRKALSDENQGLKRRCESGR